MSTPSKSKKKQVTPSWSTTQNGRLFTDSDEVRLVKTFEKLTKSTPSSSPITTTITIDSDTFNRLNSALNSKFTQSQMTDKLRRLRIKYHKQARSKSLIKTPHDQKLFKVARRLWGRQVKSKGKRVQEGQASEQQEEKEREEGEADETLLEFERNGEEKREQEVNLEDYPALISEFSKYLPLNLVWKEALKSLGNRKLREMNEKWKLIGIEEAKIVSKKAELVKEQTQLIMEVVGDATNGN